MLKERHKEPRLVVMNIVEEKSEEIQKTCKEHKVGALYAFGSVASNTFSEESDIDLLVIFGQGYEFGAFAQYFDFKEKLETILNHPVDLVCYQAIRNTVFKHEVDTTKKLLHAA